MRKISKRSEAKLSKRDIRQEVQELKRKMKKNHIVKELFKKYKVPLDFLDKVQMDFADMDVSAKTKDGKIFFNTRFLGDDGDFDEDHYAVHELTHFLQQVTDSLKEEEMCKDYLDNEHEREAFENQVQYKSEEDGKPEAKRYVKQVLDHHDMKGKKRKDVEQELLAEAHRNILNRKFASNFKEKKKEESGNITYIYDEKHIEKRNKGKAEKVKKLKTNIEKVRTKVKQDLSNKDVKISFPALAVALIDETYERVGNRESARELKHFGVTEWLARHVTINGSKATIKYVGKSGVNQKKEVTNSAVVNALKKALKGKSKNDQILSDEKFSLNDNHVNAYLRPFKITAKDIRGFHANEEMKKQLKKARSGNLPSDQKEKEKKLKTEFKKALEETAKVVGHEASTLKSQYLVPSIETNYMKSGKV